MSPLARSLLALACAALLHAACAMDVDYDPVHCSKLPMGIGSSVKVAFKRVLGPFQVKPGKVDLPAIQRLGIRLAVETVVVCSASGPPPLVEPPAEGFSPVTVTPAPGDVLPLEVVAHQYYEIVSGPDSYDV